MGAKYGKYVIGFSPETNSILLFGPRTNLYISTLNKHCGRTRDRRRTGRHMQVIFYRAMLLHGVHVLRLLAEYVVCPSVRPSVMYADSISLAFWNFITGIISPVHLLFPDITSAIYWKGYTLKVEAEQWWGGENWRFLTSKSPYVRNGEIGPRLLSITNGKSRKPFQMTRKS